MVDPDGTRPIHDVEPDDILILELLADGLDNRQMSQHLDMTEAAVKAKLRVVFRSLGVKRRSEAVAVAMRLGIIS
jgi:LuxR family maltose regulon positive regulatory protein